MEEEPETAEEAEAVEAVAEQDEGAEEVFEHDAAQVDESHGHDQGSNSSSDAEAHASEAVAEEQKPQVKVLSGSEVSGMGTQARLKREREREGGRAREMAMMGISLRNKGPTRLRVPRPSLKDAVRGGESARERGESAIGLEKRRERERRGESWYFVGVSHVLCLLFVEPEYTPVCQTFSGAL